MDIADLGSPPHPTMNRTALGGWVVVKGEGDICGRSQGLAGAGLRCSATEGLVKLLSCTIVP